MTTKEKNQIETTETEVAEAEQVAQAAESTDLTINDLNALKTIIDIASSRGTFKPAEYAAVGQTYTKLSNSLEAVAKQSEAAGTGTTGAA